MERNVWTRCLNNGCVEVKHDGDRVFVRDSKLGEESPVIEYSREGWADTLAEVRDEVWPADWWMTGGTVVWSRGGAVLRFTEQEIEEFEVGAKAGLFDLEVSA